MTPWEAAAFTQFDASPLNEDLRRRYVDTFLTFRMLLQVLRMMPWMKSRDSAGSAEAAAKVDDTHGRGLLIVRLCADNWGGYPLADDLFGISGKLLWFELTPLRSSFDIAA